MQSNDNTIAQCIAYHHCIEGSQIFERQIESLLIGLLQINSTPNFLTCPFPSKWHSSFEVHLYVPRGGWTELFNWSLPRIPLPTEIQYAKSPCGPSLLHSSSSCT